MSFPYEFQIFRALALQANNPVHHNFSKTRLQFKEMWTSKQYNLFIPTHPLEKVLWKSWRLLTKILMIIINKPCKRAFHRLRVVPVWSSQVQWLWCIKQHLCSFRNNLGLAFWFSHKINFNFLVTIVPWKLNVVITKNI